MSDAIWEFDTLWYQGNERPEPSYVKIEDNPIPYMGGKILKVVLLGKEVMRVEADYDQWGTWYDLSIIQHAYEDSDGVAHEKTEAGFTHAQEWEMGSLMKALGAAFTYMGEEAESETKLGSQYDVD